MSALHDRKLLLSQSSRLIRLAEKARKRADRYAAQGRPFDCDIARKEWVALLAGADALRAAAEPSSVQP